jgi:dihydrofolate reductase
MKPTKIKVSVYIATSVDGFIARPDGDVSWLHEVEPIGGGDDAGFGGFFDSIDVLVMGRGSFEKVLEFDWPYGTKPVIVLSKSLTEVPEGLRDRVRIDASTPQKLVEKLSQEGYKRMYLDGGKVIQSFLRNGLVDDMTLTTIPVLIGEGLPLFGSIEKDIKLRLLESRSWANGFVQSEYQVLK